MDLQKIKEDFVNIVKHNIYSKFEDQKMHFIQNNIIHILVFDYSQTFHECHYYLGIFEHMFLFYHQNNMYLGKEGHKI